MMVRMWPARCQAGRPGSADGGRGWPGGQGLVEYALALPVFLIVAVGLVQCALFLHAQSVVLGACQEGARVASAGPEDRLAAGVATADSLVRSGLGPSAAAVTITANQDGDAVTFTATGSLRLIIPWVGEPTLPLSARVVNQKERFHVAP